jgi:DNA ligase (NAD+)
VVFTIDDDYIACGSKSEANKKIIELRKWIKYRNHLYYQENQSAISDLEYDKVKAALIELEFQFPDLVDANSPTQKISGQLSRQFSKIKHLHKVLSLDDIFTHDALLNFIDKTKNFLQSTNGIEFVIEPKIDGLTLVLKYENGILVSAATRGDGTYGENITKNALAINEIPKTIPTQLNGIQINTLEIRGEIYMNRDDFDQLNNSASKKIENDLKLNQGSFDFCSDGNGQNCDMQMHNEQNRQNLNKEESAETPLLFSTARHAASGSLRQLDYRITAERNLHFFIHGLASYDEFISAGINKYSDCMKILASWGFFYCDNAISQTVDVIEEYYQYIFKNRLSIPYDIDGAVCKVNDLLLQKRLSSSSRTPRFAIAYKFNSIQAETTVTNIKVQVGRGGSITPVAELIPVNIGGVIVSRATLHNNQDLEKKDIRIGDRVLIERSGDVIPKITNVVEHLRDDSVTPFEFPKACPSCNTTLVKKNNLLKCPAYFTCEEQCILRLEHAVSRDALNIEGLGKKNIEQLYKIKYITNLKDIFDLHVYVDSLSKMDGWAEISVNNLLRNIEFSRTMPLSRFIYSLSIPLVGKNTAISIAKHYKKANEFFHAACSKEIICDGEDGIGIAINEEIHRFFENCSEEVIRLSEVLQISDYIENINQQTDNRLFNKRVVITGKFAQLSRREIKSRLEQIGSVVMSSISSKTDFLICGENSGGKIQQANDFAIPIIYEEDLLTLLQH